MVTDTSCVRQKPHRRANRQIWAQPSTSTKVIARLWCQDCCVGNSQSGRWALTSSPTWTDGSVRKRSTRSCGMRPSTTWLDAPSYTTLSTWQTRSAKLSMVRFESVSGSLLNHNKNQMLDIWCLDSLKVYFLKPEKITLFCSEGFEMFSKTMKILTLKIT